MKGLAEVTFGPSRPFILCGRRLAGRFSRDTDLKVEKSERNDHFTVRVRSLSSVRFYGQVRAQQSRSGPE